MADAKTTLETGLGKPTEALGNLDVSIQIAEIQLEAMQGLETLQDSLPQMLDALGQMKGDLKGEALNLGDIYDVHQVGDEFPYPTLKDATTVDGTALPANLVATAVEGQETLTTLAEALTTDFKAFADHQSSLLSGLKDLQAGLTRGSELFESVETGIKRFEDGAKLFKQVLAGEISDEKLMEAFTDHLTMLTDILKPLTDKIPGIGDIIQGYVDSVKLVGPKVESLRLAKLQSEKASDAFDQAVEGTTGTTGATEPDTAPAEPTHITQLEAKLVELRQQRAALLEEWHASIGARTDLEVGPLIAEATRRLLADGVTPRTPAEIKAETGALAVLQIRQRAELQSDHPERAAALGVQISAAKEAQTAAAAADLEVERKLEAHVAQLMLERSYQLGPTDLTYLEDRFDGEVDDAAEDLKEKMPEGSVGGAVLLHGNPKPKSLRQRFEAALSRWFSSPQMAGLGLIAVVAVVVVGFLLFGGGDDEPELLAAGSGPVATATSEAAATAQGAITTGGTVEATPESTATEEVVFGRIAPPHFSVCPDGTVLSGPVKADSDGNPVLDDAGNKVNEDTGESFVCPE